MITTLALALALAGAPAPTLPQAQPAGQAQINGFVLTAEVKTQTLESLIKHMNEIYVLPDVAVKIEGALRTWMAGEDFKSITAPQAFAAKVNEILKANVTDAHLRFRYSPEKLPERRVASEPSAVEIANYRRELKFVNAHFEKVERLRGNVGYISFRQFASPEDMKRPVEAAMKFLADTDAMIVDLRGNGGGQPEGVRLFCSYFFDTKPVLLNTIYFRQGNRTREFWTVEKVDGPRYLNKPLYVVVGPRTGSGAEECAYNLQNLKRGTIVGMPTWGGANPGGTVRLSDHFGCFIPTGRAINPYTKTNWEGTGVQPDVKVEVEKALKEAHVMALRALAEKETDPDFKRDREQIAKEVAESGL